MTKEIDEFLNANAPYFPRSSFEAQNAIFCGGQLVTVSRCKGEKRADFKKVVGVEEVWSFCFRQPRPGGRLLGRFVRENIFVGTCMRDRHELGGSEYRVAAEGVAQNWSIATGSVPFVSSEDLIDYFGTTVYRDLDDGTD